MSTQPISIEEFKEAMPAHIRKNVNPPLLVEINAAMADPEVLAVYRENVLGYSSVLREGRFKIGDYLNAVRYVSHKLLGDTNIQAWSKTFPDRYNNMQKRGNTEAEIASVCSRYGSSKLVVLMMSQAMVPTHILNAPLFQQALNVQASLMLTAKSEMVRSTAASALMAALKPPEATKVELDISLKEDDSIKLLRQTTMALAREQQNAITAGAMSVKSVAEMTLIGETDTTEEKAINV